jgi:hypothetical protein
MRSAAPGRVIFPIEFFLKNYFLAGRTSRSALRVGTIRSNVTWEPDFLSAQF